MPGPEGFDYETRGGEVVITHHGRRATVLRGSAAARFLADVEDDDDAGADGARHRQLPAGQRADGEEPPAQRPPEALLRRYFEGSGVSTLTSEHFTLGLIPV